MRCLLLAYIFCHFQLYAEEPKTGLHNALLQEGKHPLSITYEWKQQEQQLSLTARDWWKLVRTLEEGRWDSQALAPVQEQLPLTMSTIQMEGARHIQAAIAGVELLENFDSYRRLRSLVDAELRQSDNFYFPSPLLKQGTTKQSRMQEWEDQLFLRWSAFSETQQDMNDPEFDNLLRRLSDKEPGSTRDTFNLLLELSVNAREEQLWTEFRQSMDPHLSNERRDLLRALLPPLESVLVQRKWTQDRPQNLLLEVSDKGINIPVGAPLQVRYAYELGTDVPHSARLSLHDLDGTLREQRTLDSSQSSGSCTLPGLARAGNYVLTMTVRTRYGWQAVKECCLLISGDPSSEDSVQLLKTFGSALRTRAQDATRQLNLLASEQQEIERQLSPATKSLDELEEEISADNVYTTAAAQRSKWLRSGRYDDYLKALADYNALVERSENIELQGELLEAQRQELLLLSEAIASRLRKHDVEGAMAVARSSSYAEQFGYGHRFELAAAPLAPQEKPSPPVAVAPEQARGFVRAVLNNDLAAASKSLADGVDINARDPYSNEQILHLYIRAAKLHVETVQFLVDHGADPYAGDAQGNGLTPLMLLALSPNDSAERKKILHYFIDLGVPFTPDAVAQVRDKKELLRQLETAETRPYLYDQSIDLLRQAL